jgi:peptidyl-prolyl cis-trans isomerase C
MKLPVYIAVLALLTAPVLAADETVIAIVNGEKLTKTDLEENMKGMPEQIQQLPLNAIYPQILEQMVVERIVRKAGYDADLDGSTEVKNRMKEAEKKIVADEYLRREVKKKITDEQLKKDYDAYAAKFKGEEEVRASHILVKTEKEALDIIKQVKGGADFAKLAAEKSLDKGAAAQGGDLGYFAKGQMVPEFEKAAFAMKTGDVSTKPVKTEFGYHVLKVVDKRTSKPETFETLKPRIEAEASKKAAQELVKELMQKADVQRFDLEGKPLATKAEIKK